jgi:phosphohistidine phosphatase
MEVRDELYESTTRQYLATINAVEGDMPLMIIGHNPVCDDLTRLLITGDGDAAQAFLPTHFPTGGLAVLDFDAKCWQDIIPTTGDLADFVRPKNL